MSEQADAVKEVEMQDNVEQVIEAWVAKRKWNVYRKRGDRITFMADGADLASWSGAFGAVIGDEGPVDTIHSLGELRERLGLSPWIAEEQPDVSTGTTPEEVMKQEHIESLTRELRHLGEKLRMAYEALDQSSLEKDALRARIKVLVNEKSVLEGMGRGEAAAEMAALREQVIAQTETVATLRQERADLAAHVERLEVDLQRTRELLDLGNEVRGALREAMYRREEAHHSKREHKQALRAAKRAQEALALAEDSLSRAVSRQWIAVENRSET